MINIPFGAKKDRGSLVPCAESCGFQPKVAVICTSRHPLDQPPEKNCNSGTSPLSSTAKNNNSPNSPATISRLTQGVFAPGHLLEAVNPKFRCRANKIRALFNFHFSGIFPRRIASRRIHGRRPCPAFRARTRAPGSTCSQSPAPPSSRRGMETRRRCPFLFPFFLGGGRGWLFLSCCFFFLNSRSTGFVWSFYCFCLFFSPRNSRSTGFVWSFYSFCCVFGSTGFVWSFYCFCLFLTIHMLIFEYFKEHTIINK